MHINKTLTLKGTKKSEKNPKLQERKSNLLNEKLELIKLSKYTHKKIYTQQQDYLLTHIGEKQWSKTTQHGFSVKGKENTALCPSATWESRGSRKSGSTPMS